MQWIILLGHEVCAIGFEKITCMSSFCQVAKSEWEPELDLWVNSSEFRNVSSVGSVSSRECLDAPAILATFTAGRTGLVACP